LIQWVNAKASGDNKLATFYTDRFRLPRVRRHGRLVATFPVSVSV
jgi:hypothetical protein